MNRFAQHPDWELSRSPFLIRFSIACTSHPPISDFGLYQRDCDADKLDSLLAVESTSTALRAAASSRFHLSPVAICSARAKPAVSLSSNNLAGSHQQLRGHGWCNRLRCDWSAGLPTDPAD
jgi:hypothetical protein